MCLHICAIYTRALALLFSSCAGVETAHSILPHSVPRLPAPFMRAPTHPRFPPAQAQVLDVMRTGSMTPERKEQLELLRLELGVPEEMAQRVIKATRSQVGS